MLNLNHKFANIQTAFDLLSALVLRDHSWWRARKSKHSKEMMLIRTFFLKGINNDRKIFTHNEIIDRIVEQIVQLIKIMDSCKHTAVKSLFTYSSKLSYSGIWTLKKNFVKENKKTFRAIKTTTNHKNLSKRFITTSINITGRL